MASSRPEVDLRSSPHCHDQKIHFRTSDLIGAILLAELSVLVFAIEHRIPVQKPILSLTQLFPARENNIATIETLL